MTNSNPPSPLFATVARAGLPFGLVLALTSTVRLLSALTFPPLILLYYVGVIVIPIVAYRSARFYRDSHFYGCPFRFAQGFSYTVLIHALGGIVALLPQYFYFKLVIPSLLDRAQPIFRQIWGSRASELFTELQGVTTFEWLWTDYSLTLVLGIVWGIIVGLALRRH